MASGDPYFTCDNNFLSIEQVFRGMIVIDGNGRPVIDGISTNLGFNFNVQSKTALTSWRDGLGLVSFNGRLKEFGGWNNAGAFTPGPSTNQQFDSFDNGLTFTQISDAPWTERHSFAYGVMGGQVVMMGGDLYSGGIYMRDVWTFDDTNGWVLKTSDWGNGLGDRVLMSGCAHSDGYFYVGGGQRDYGSTMVVYNDIYRTSDFVNFTFFATLPIGYFSAGQMISANGSIFILGGGQYSNTGGINLNADVYKLNTNTGVFDNTGTLPANLVGLYQNAIFWKNRIFMMAGSNVTNPNRDSINNVQGLFWSDNNGATWTEILAPEARHASSMAIHNDELYILSGNYQNDIIKITAVTMPEINPELNNYYSSLNIKPTPASIVRLNNFISDLGPEVLNIDFLQIIAGLETNQQRLKPIKSTSGDDSEIISSSSANYILDKNGFKRVNVAYINLKWNVFNDAVNSTQNGYFVAIFNTSNEATNGTEIGAISANASETLIFSRYNDGNIYASINNNGVEGVEAVADALGYRAVERVSSTIFKIFVNTTSYSKSFNSLNAQSTDLFLGATNSQNVQALYPSPRRQTSVIIGKSGANHGLIRQALLNYFAASGVQLN